MPTFSLTAHTDGPVEEVWKLLHDPTRYPEWWEGVETIEVSAVADAQTAYTMWPQGYPDFPMAQRLEAAPGRVTISCLVSDLVYGWQLREDGTGTHIDLHVEIPEREAHRLAGQRQLMSGALTALAQLAAAG